MYAKYKRNKMEGPSIHLLADELQLFVNSTITKAYGNAAFEKEVLVQQQIHEIFAFGKRLIVQLDTHALVIHFLMYGTYRINNQRPQMTPRLALITSNGDVYFYNCSIKCLDKQNIKNLIPMEYDILSPQWNIKKIFKIIQSHKNATIDDILLNQNIFPGVGNIIKNEVLFLSKTSPLKKIKQLSTSKIVQIIRNARLFSQKFLELRKQNELKKNLQIYRKSYCPICNTKVIRIKTGITKRWSFVCPTCQK